MLVLLVGEAKEKMLEPITFSQILFPPTSSESNVVFVLNLEQEAMQYNELMFKLENCM